MSAITGRSGLCPGDCLAILAQLNGHRKKGRHVHELPRRAKADAEDMLDAVRGYMNVDPHVGPMLEAAVEMVEQAVAAGALGALQQMDLRTIGNFLRVVPPTQRPR